MTRDSQDARPTEASVRRHDGSALRAFYATKNPTKIKDSINDIRFFAKFCGLENEEQVEEILLGPSATREAAQDLVTRYRDHLRSKNMAYGTINRRLAAIRTLVRMAKLTGLVSWDIDVSAGDKLLTRDIRGVSKKALKVAERMSDASRRARRDKAIVLMTHEANLTRAEVSGLALEHYDPDPGRPSVHIKGHRLALSKKAKRALDAWIEVRGFRTGPLFTGPDGSSPVSPEDLIALVRPGSILS